MFDSLTDKQKTLLKEIALGTSLILLLEASGLRKKIMSSIPHDQRVELLGLGSILLAKYIG